MSKLFAVVLLQALQFPAVTVTPAVVADIDLGKLKGVAIRQLAWSPDAMQLYFQTCDFGRGSAPVNLTHYVMPAKGGAPKRVDDQPEWANIYWAWKADRHAPGDPTFAIEIEQQKSLSSATAMPMGGDLARGGDTGGSTTGASMQSMIEAAQVSRSAAPIRMRLKGQIVGEWPGPPIAPGLTFGWAPQDTGLIAFSEPGTGRLVVMDKTGTTQKFEGTKNIFLPAWTADAAKLAYFESRGGKKYALVVASVAK